MAEVVVRVHLLSQTIVYHFFLRRPSIHIGIRLTSFFGRPSSCLVVHLPVLNTVLSLFRWSPVSNCHLSIIRFIKFIWSIKVLPCLNQHRFLLCTFLVFFHQGAYKDVCDLQEYYFPVVTGLFVASFLENWCNIPFFLFMALVLLVKYLQTINLQVDLFRASPLCFRQSASTQMLLIFFNKE